MNASGAHQRGLRSGIDEARQAGFIALGCLMLLLGIIGAFLPLMPTTIFLICAAWCFGRSSPRLEAWMLAHPTTGPVIRDWREHGAMPRRVKWLACGGMAIGYALFIVAAAPSLWLALAGAVPILGCAVWIVRRPEPAVLITSPETAAEDATGTPRAPAGRYEREAVLP